MEHYEHFYIVHSIGDAIEERMTLDVSGHYQRADLFDRRVKAGAGELKLPRLNQTSALQTKHLSCYK
jgi:hypothetical protein